MSGGPKSALNSGMSLRDYFAAKAMEAIIGKVPIKELPVNSTEWEKIRRRVARGAYSYADAMLAARDAKPSDQK